MKKQGTGIGEQGSDAMERLLRGAILPMETNPEPGHDLWPALQARLNAQPPLTSRLRAVPWFDWALVTALAVFAVAFPAAIPMLLYYL